jgi:3-hydroxyacyl-CoA dehydrogenase
VLNNHPIKGEQLEQLHRQESRGARGRRHGRADRRAPAPTPNVPVVLFDLPAKEGDPNGIVKKALDGLKKLEPTPLRHQGPYQPTSTLPTTSRHLELLKRLRPRSSRPLPRRWSGSDDLYRRRSAPFIAPSRRSSPATLPACRLIRLAEGAAGSPPQPNFCGIHFFNPPRYMQLVEMIATARQRCRNARTTLSRGLCPRLGKGVVRALDTPNFVANRVGVFSMLAVMHHTRAASASASTWSMRLTGPSDRPPEERHLPHRRRRWPRHHGARHQDHAGHAAE